MIDIDHGRHDGCRNQLTLADQRLHGSDDEQRGEQVGGPVQRRLGQHRRADLLVDVLISCEEDACTNAHTRVRRERLEHQPLGPASADGDPVDALTDRVSFSLGHRVSFSLGQVNPRAFERAGSVMLAG
jgi:hypothetical protein